MQRWRQLIARTMRRSSVFDCESRLTDRLHRAYGGTSPHSAGAYRVFRT